MTSRMRLVSALLFSFLLFACDSDNRASLTTPPSNGSQSNSGSQNPGSSNTNRAPVSNAGTDQSVLVGQLVTLDGSRSSDPDGNSINYTWHFSSTPPGSSASLDSPNDIKPTFVADTEGQYIASLTVSDGKSNSGTDSVTVSVSTDNSSPVANAGVDQNVATGTLVTLDGSNSSDSDGDTLSYSWSSKSAPQGSLTTLDNESSPRPKFYPDLDGQYTFELVVSDGELQSEPDTIVVTSSTANSTPVANAGDNQNVQTGSTVTLSGSESSDADGDSLTYFWSISSKPASSVTTLENDTGTNLQFVPDTDGQYVIQLIVNDGTISSEPDTVLITSATTNSAPIADAGSDQEVNVGDTVTLDGSNSSDSDGDAIAYSWQAVSKPLGSSAELSNNSAETPIFNADIAGSYVFSLTVNDGLESSEADSVTVTAAAPYISLFRNRGLFTPRYEETAFPYSSKSTSTVNVTGIPTPTSYTLDEFQIVAHGANFTIDSLQAADRAGIVSPYFTGISESDTISDGASIFFTLETPLTNGETADLIFTFTIQETGETFVAEYTVTTN